MAINNDAAKTIADRIKVELKAKDFSDFEQSLRFEIDERVFYETLPEGYTKETVDGVVGHFNNFRYGIKLAVVELVTETLQAASQRPDFDKDYFLSNLQELFLTSKTDLGRVYSGFEYNPVKEKACLKQVLSAPKLNTDSTEWLDQKLNEAIQDALKD